MKKMMRLPAFPLVTSDPYISLWSASDDPTQDDTRHWAGERKRMHWTVTVDGKTYSILGQQRQGKMPLPAAKLTGSDVTPTCTTYTYEVGGVSFVLRFRAPALLDDLDLLSMPITYLDLDFKAEDGKAHSVQSRFVLHDDICYDGLEPVPMLGNAYEDEGLSLAYMGRKKQNMLSHTGDHITIDWGYAYLAAKKGIAFERIRGHFGLTSSYEAEAGDRKKSHSFMLGYDDVASINYFGYIAKAWYTREGRTIIDALHHCHANRKEILSRCEAFDKQLLSDAKAVSGDAYAMLLSAAYRHTIAAHKLIADKEGRPIFFSKENDSNGCMGTADVSYPSIPLFLLYAPELVRAMCRPILHFASLPAWKDDFAPHDVGRYPHATGQVYGLLDEAFGCGISDPIQNGDAYPNLYLYRGKKNIYDLRYQMPVEECGNMILMLAAALRVENNPELIQEYLPLLEKWVKYLLEYGEDPGEQLCTDDFAGHLAHNVNLAYKAISGIAAYGWIQGQLGNKKEEKKYMDSAKAMAAAVQKKADRGDHTALTLDAEGWSLKYNTIWSILFDFGIWDDSFFEKELAYYQKMQNQYGVPLDSRADYTKSDWILWVASMSKDPKVVESFCAPIVKYLEESPTRIAFGDWYDTVTGRYCHFIARSVQGGLFMPLLRKKLGK